MSATNNVKRYAIDRRIVGQVINHNGHAERFEQWRQIAEVDAPRAGKALSAAGQKWPGWVMRARQIRGGAL